MLWKGKGGTDDMAQYRAVCLQEIGLKLAASMMLARLSVEVGETQRSKTQEGSGKGKESSSQDNQDGLFANRTSLLDNQTFLTAGQDPGGPDTFR